MHPLTDQLPDHMDALALRQACGEIEAGLWRDLREARSREIVALNRLATWRNRAESAESQCDDLRAEVEAALPAMRAYAAQHPRHHFGPSLQDPNGAHAWLERNDSAALTPAEVTNDD